MPGRGGPHVVVDARNCQQILCVGEYWRRVHEVEGLSNGLCDAMRPTTGGMIVAQPGDGCAHEVVERHAWT